MTDHNVKHIEKDLYQVTIRSGERDCIATGMSLAHILSVVPVIDVNKSDHVVMTVKTERSRAEVEHVVENLLETQIAW